MYMWYSCNAIYITPTGHDLFSSLCSMMQGELKTIGDLLNTVPESHHKEMGRYYLMDLINSTWRSSISFSRRNLREKEIQVMLLT